MVENGISGKDRMILREIAKKQLEISQTPEMKTLVNEWRLHNDCKSHKVMIVIEMKTFENEVLSPMLSCEGALARQLEGELYSEFAGSMLFNDDSIVRDFFPIIQPKEFCPFQIPVRMKRADSSGGIGHQFQEAIYDLEQDFHLLQPASFGSGMEKCLEKKKIAEDVFGDILPVRIIGSSMDVGLTRDLVHIMKMETMMLSMYDYPELFHKMMEMLSDDYLAYFHFLEENKCLFSTRESEPVWQGTYAYTNDLPENRPDGMKINEIWGYMDSQETSGVSPDMYHEFIFPYYKKIAKEFGLVSYGCCEPVYSIWEKDISQFRNLRRVSISPWCNEEIMGERLKGKRIIYHRKPNPNYLGVDKILDEEAVRKHFRKTMAAAKDCFLEITQRDVYTIHHNIDKVRNYVKIIRQCAEYR